MQGRVVGGSLFCEASKHACLCPRGALGPRRDRVLKRWFGVWELIGAMETPREDEGKGEGDLIDRLDAKASPKRSPGSPASPSSAGSPELGNAASTVKDESVSEITPSAKDDTSSATGGTVEGARGKGGKQDDSWKKMPPEDLFNKVSEFTIMPTTVTTITTSSSSLTLVGHLPTSQYDADNSGFIDFDEFKVMLPDLGVKLNEAKAWKYFRQVDTDGSGEIGLDEFKVALFIVDPTSGNTVGFNPSSLLTAKDAFDMFDEDHSGSIDEDEFALACEYMQLGLSDEKMETMFMRHDRDGSGTIDYHEFREVWLSACNPRKELEGRGIPVGKYATRFQLVSKLRKVLDEEEEKEEKAQAAAAKFAVYQKDLHQKKIDAAAAIKRADEELCNAMDNAGQVYIFGAGSHNQFVDDAVRPAKHHAEFEHLRKLWCTRVAPDGGNNHLKASMSVKETLELASKGHAASVTSGSSPNQKDSESPFDGLVCAVGTCSLWGRGVVKVGIGENTAFALTKFGEILAWGGRNHLWDEILPGSRWAKEDRGQMTQRSQLLLGMRGRKSWKVEEEDRKKRKLEIEGGGRILTDEDRWINKMKVVAFYFDVFEPLPKTDRKTYMIDVILAKVPYEDVHRALSIRGKTDKHLENKNKNTLMMELEEDLTFEMDQIGPRGQKRVRVIELEIADFERRGKLSRAQKLRRELLELYWTELTQKQIEKRAADKQAEFDNIEATYRKGERRYFRWRRKIDSADKDLLEHSPRSGKSRIQLGGITRRGAGPRITPMGGRVRDISVGAHHVAAVHISGDLYAWGDNNFGRLGIKMENARTEVSHPTRLTKGMEMRRAIAVECGYSHNAAILRDRTIVMWGGATTGKLGIGDVAEEFECFCEYPIPVEIPGGREVRMVACGRTHTACVSMSGALFVWGAGDGGRLGLGENDTEVKTIPTLVEYLLALDIKVWAVACGASHTLICTEVMHLSKGHGASKVDIVRGGELMQCGAAAALGAYTPMFKVVEKLKNRPVCSIAAGDNHSAAVTVTGELYTWGLNANGCGGHPTSVLFSAEPTVVSCLYVASESLCKEKPAKQSSVYNHRGAEIAVDGNLSGEGEESCIHTLMDQNAWWEVDLGRLAVINTIKIWNREDIPIDESLGVDYFTGRLFPCWVFLGSEPFSEDTGPKSLESSFNSAVARQKLTNNKRETVWELPTNSIGRYIRVQLEGTSYLHFAQLEAFGQWGIHKSVGKVSKVFCAHQVTCAVMTVEKNLQNLELGYIRAIQADPYAAHILRQYREYISYYDKYGERDPNPHKCFNCRGGIKCALCVFRHSWPISKVQGYNPRGPGGRLRRLRSLTKLVVEEPMRPPKLKKKKRKKKGLFSGLLSRARKSKQKEDSETDGDVTSGEDVMVAIDDGEKGTDASHKGLLKLPALDGVEKVPETTSASAEAEVKDGGAKGGGETPALPEATTSKKKRFGIFG